VILHREGRVLLQHRDDDPAIRWPGAWALFGGHMEPNESPEETARREIEEELGLSLEGTLELVYHGTSESVERWIYAAPLLVLPDSLTLAEGQGMALISSDDVDGYPVVPLHRQILDRWWADLAY